MTIQIYKNHISKITIDLSKIVTTSGNTQDRVLANLFSQYFSNYHTDQTCSLKFSLEENPMITIYKWDFQDVKTRLIAQGYQEDKALELIHQRQENNSTLIVNFFVDLYYLKNTNKYRPSLFNLQHQNRLHDHNDNYLQLDFHHELFDDCIEYLTKIQTTQEQETYLQERWYEMMKNDNVRASEVRYQFAKKLEKFSHTLEEIEKDANENNPSGSLGLKEYIQQLNLKKENLYNSKFKFLTLGDFNLGKSTILNVLLRNDVLPTDVTPCTAIPTIIKYGSEKKVLVHRKNFVPLELSIEKFKQEFTSSSTTLTDRINKKGKELRQYLKQYFQTYQYAVLEYPLPLLEQGIEFIDSPGLNNSLEDNEKSLYYIDKVDAVFFVLDSRKPLTEQEQQYLKQYIQGNVETVFYLINYWDQVEIDDQEKVRQAFINRLSEALDIKYTEVEKMWGKRIFEISARNDLRIINHSQSIQGTTCENFWEQLQLFLVSNRLSSELSDALRITKNIYNAIKEIVELRLVTLNYGLEEINNKVKNCEPHFDIMEDIIEELQVKVDSEKKQCANKTTQKYEEHFNNVCKNFQDDFQLPELKSLKQEDIENFRSKVEQEYQQYIQNKYSEWDKVIQLDLDSRFELLEQNFKISITKYQQTKNQIKDILQGNEETIQLRDHPKTSINELPNLPNMTAIPGRKKIYSIGGPLVSAVVGGGGGAGLAAYLNVALIAAGSLTPMGWGIIGVSAIASVIGKLVGDKLNNEEIKQKIKDELQNSLSNMNNEKQLETIRDKVQRLFDIYSSTVNDLNNDVLCLQNSLNNLIEQKRTREIDCKSVTNSLKDFVNNISSQLDKIEADFREYLQVKNSEQVIDDSN